MFVYDYVLVSILIFTRMAAMFGIIPVFGARNTPMQTKIGLVFFVTMILVPSQVETFNLSIDTFLDLGSYMVVESLVGFAMGMVVLITMNVFYLAGSLVDRNIGFAMVSVIGAEDESQLPVSANLYYIFALMIFLVTNVHHLLIRALAESYSSMPIGSNPLYGLIVYDFTALLKYTFVTGFQMAAPFILTILIANILLGLLSKAMPGMNVFMIGMPLKILIGLFLFHLVMAVYPNFIVEIFSVMMQYLIRLVGL